MTLYSLLIVVKLNKKNSTLFRFPLNAHKRNFLSKVLLHSFSLSLTLSLFHLTALLLVRKQALWVLPSASLSTYCELLQSP